MLVMVTRKDPDIQFSEVYRDFEGEKVDPNETGFDVAFELTFSTVTSNSVRFADAKKQGIDDSYFNVSAYAVAHNDKEDGT